MLSGEFLKILFAESKDRTDVFRKIFETDIYNLITKKLVEKQKEYKDDLKDLKNTFVTNTNNIIWKENSNIFETVSSKELNRLDIEKVLSLLEKEIEINKEDYTAINDKNEVLEKDCKKIDEKIKKQIQDNDNIDKYNKLLENQKVLDEKMEYISSQKDFLEKNQKILSAVLPKEEIVLTLKKDISSYEKNIEILNKEIEIGKEKEKNNKDKEKKLNELKEIYLKYCDLSDEYKDIEIEKNKINEIENVKKEKEKLVKEYEHVALEYKNISIKYIEEEELFFKEQAGIIAEKIKVGEPCPVCGSIEHPCIAKKSENVLSKEDLEKLKIECENKKNKNDEIKNKITHVNSKYDVLISQIKDNEKEDFDLEKYAKNIDKIIKDIINKMQICDNECNNIYYEICSKKFKKDIFDFDSFKTEFEKNMKIDEEKFIENQALQKEYENQKKNKIKDLNFAVKEYEKAYKSLGFKSEKDYKENTCDESEIKKINKEIDNYNKCVTENKTMISELQKIIKTKEKIDVEQDKKNLFEMKKELEEKRKEQMRLKGILDNNKRMNTSLKNTSNSLLEKIDEFVVYDELARTASGMLQGKRRIEFEQYVQSAYFDMVIIEANKRLSQMTDNRYILVRKESAEKASDRIGLDLEVIDNYNGKKRDVRSLSGGEAFKAALSLALGLSDIIQSYSGGVVIDTLFIDEGFGSLDSESRDQAIATLSSLIDGNKLIGIISHVTELKDRIDKKIIVSKGKDGSVINIEC